MHYLAVFACLVAAAAASNHMGYMGHMGNNMGNNFGQMMNQGWNQGMYGNQGNYLQQLLQGQMGQQQSHYQQGWNMGGQMYGQQRPQQQQQNGMSNNILGSMLGNMLGNMMMMNLRGQMGYQNTQVTNEEKEGIERMEELMKMSMATELFDVMRAYNKFKDDEEEFGKAMYHLCFMVNATWAAARQYNFEVFNKTTDESVEQMGREAEGLSEAEKMKGTIDLMMTDPKMFEEIFFRMATWSCWAGKDYLDSAMKLDKISRGNKCDH